MNQEHISPMTDEPAIGFSYQINLGEGRQLVFQTHVPQRIAKADLAAVLDKLRYAADLELTAARIDQIRADVEQAELMIGNAEANIAHLDRRHAETAANQSTRGTARSKADEQKDAQERVNAQSTLARAKEIKAEKEAKIAELEKKLNGVHRSTDSGARDADR